jgi:hypothetical protein
MSEQADIVTQIMENMETIMAFVGLAIALIRLTSWGRANGKALDAVVDAIEKIDIADDQKAKVKAEVKNKMTTLGGDSADAIDHAVRRADPKKPTPSKIEIFAKAALRTIRIGKRRS